MKSEQQKQYEQEALSLWPGVLQFISECVKDISRPHRRRGH
jgi:hypothetical protein